MIVPTRHSYAEGLPNSIIEGLSSRSTLVISDHPSFSGRLIADGECMIFKAGDARSLARTIKRLCDDPTSYATLPSNAETAVKKLNLGMDWKDMIYEFVADPTNQTGWVEKNSLANFV